MTRPTNPILPGFNPDPSIVRVGDVYYVATSTFEWYPGVAVHASTDLVNWSIAARPLDRAGLLDLRGRPDSGGVWAPCLTHADGRFHLVYAAHPNFSHVVVFGLGCEGNQIGSIFQGRPDVSSVLKYNIQSLGGARKAVEQGVAFVRDVLAESNAARRETVPASELSLALVCGGSDGYSGISANPALGAASDLLVAEGGTVILAETPETYGAEHLLTRRAISRAVGETLVERMAWWEQYSARQGVTLNANPSPGNKLGGLTTILEKSLGALSKAGSANLMEVVHYAERPSAKGLIFMDTPGYDPVQVTGQIAGGANIVAFTTGRGSVFGSKPAPTVKLASNTRMFNHMAEDMDVNCGTILDGEESVEQCGARIFRTLLEVASGKRTRSEELDFGAAEFAPWTLGPVI